MNTPISHVVTLYLGSLGSFKRCLRIFGLVPGPVYVSKAGPNDLFVHLGFLRNVQGYLWRGIKHNIISIHSNNFKHISLRTCLCTQARKPVQHKISFSMNLFIYFTLTTFIWVYFFKNRGKLKPFLYFSTSKGSSIKHKFCYSVQSVKPDGAWQK